MPPDDERARRESATIRAARFAAFGFEFAGTIVGGVLFGHWIDVKLGTEPLFTLAVTLAGMIGALYRLLWNLKQSNSQAQHGD